MSLGVGVGMMNAVGVGMGVTGPVRVHMLMLVRTLVRMPVHMPVHILMLAFAERKRGDV